MNLSSFAGLPFFFNVYVNMQIFDWNYIKNTSTSKTRIKGRAEGRLQMQPVRISRERARRSSVYDRDDKSDKGTSR